MRLDQNVHILYTKMFKIQKKNYLNDFNALNFHRKLLPHPQNPIILIN